MMRTRHSRNNLIQMGGVMTAITRSHFLPPLALALVLLAAAPGRTAAQEPGGAADGGLRAGDVVEVTVWQRDELSGEFTVAPDGSLNHPLYRQIRVTGIPATQIEQRLREFLSAYEANPQVVVQPFYKVAVAGPVMRPDIYNVPPGSTVSEVVTQAGGVLDSGKRDDVRLFRGGQELELDLTETEGMLTPVRSGDQILVMPDSGESAFRSVVLPILQIGFSIANILIYR